MKKRKFANVQDEPAKTTDTFETKLMAPGHIIL